MSNKIIDYISGIKINATPEELEAVQPLSQELVEVYGYNKDEIKTHPQFLISLSPSDEKRSYPVDIVVFENNQLKIICECKKISSQKGKEQLRKYLRMCEAKFGVWFNGQEHIILKKIETSQGISFKELNDILPFGIWEETHPRYEELKPRENLKSVFYQIKKSLQKTVIGSTNEPDIAKNVLKILFCKIFDERYQSENGFVEFYASVDKWQESSEKIRAIFTKVKNKFEDVFSKTEEINIDEKSIVLVVQKLQWISLINSGRDAVADAFEVFIGTALKGEHGQFFTPRNVVRFIINFLEVDETQKIIDPACGTGGFIVEALRYIWKKMDKKFSTKKWEKGEIEREKITVARKNIFGCDKDSFLAQACKAYMCILGDGSTNVWNDDSLIKFTDNWQEKYEIVITNPPFGKTIAVEDEKILKKFSFWRQEKDRSVQPQILFLELCLRLLKKNGKLAIVLPEGIFGNESENYRKIRSFLLENYNLLAVFSIPQETFEPFTGNKSSILVLENKKCDEKSKVIFADIQKIGHNKRGETLYKYDNSGILLKDEQGNFVVNDELSNILSIIQEKNIFHYQKTNQETKVFYVLTKEIKVTQNFFLIPSYYSGFLKLLSELKESKKEENSFSISISELVEKNILFTNKNKNIPRGKAVDSHFYLPYKKGLIPFIRTSDLQNLEITRRPQKWVNREVYENYKEIQDIKTYDILFVKDGMERIGETAMVMPGEEELILQSHLFKLRINSNEINLDNFNFLYFLNQEYVVKQIKKLIFTQGTIPTIGERIKELTLWIPKNKEECQKISDYMKKSLLSKYEFKKELKNC